MSKPFYAVFDGGCFMPMKHALAMTGETWVQGVVYRLVRYERDRSSETHNHYFACIAEAFDNLPERYKHEWWAHNEDALRKHALIETGWCEKSSFTFSTVEQVAKAVLAFRERDK